MFARVVIIALVGIVLWAIVARSSSGAGHEATYVVQPADTLWSIATSHYSGDPRAAIWKVRCCCVCSGCRFVAAVRRSRLPNRNRHRSPLQKLLKKEARWRRLA